jgi:predicted methyltransferase
MHIFLSNFIMQKYYVKKHQEKYQELMEIYLEFLHKNLTCRRCKKQGPVVQTARKFMQNEKTSNTGPRPKHVVDQGYRERMETVGLIQMDQTLNLTVATLVQR